MNIYLSFILVFLIGSYVLNMVVEWLNLKQCTPIIPDEFKETYDAEKYKKSQHYLSDNTRFDCAQTTFSLCLLLPFILIGGFNTLDIIIRGFGYNPLITGIIYIMSLLFISQLLGLPFQWYKTFVIEEKYGFNKTTYKTFFTDLVKGTLLSMMIGVPLLGAILWFFETTGDNAWLICWGFLSVMQLFLMFIAPTFIMPLFNKFEPLEDGELKETIEAYAKEHQFKCKGLYTMDGSKRSSKSNAFFTGFGHSRRIVLFDTLIKNHTTQELLTVLAHEMGHYKKMHIQKHILFSIATSGITFYILSLFLNNPGLFSAFKMDQLSIYASLIFFSFLFSPIQEGLSIITNIMSRKHEFEADAYAVTTTNQPESLISGLKKLSVDNLSNLTPHPLKVFLDYSHPPVLQRIQAIKSIPTS